MRTILAATDFSESAKNSVSYAANYAVAYSAKLILFHAFHLPLPVGEMQVPVVDYDQLLDENKKSLERLKKEILLANPYLDVECIVKPGFAIEEISSMKPDLVVMGIKGAGKISEVIIGSNAVGVIRHSKCPVLVVPEACRFKKLDKIVFAADYNEVKDAHVFDMLLKTAKVFSAELMLLHVTKKATESLTEIIQGLKLESAFDGVLHSKHHVQDDDLVHGINEFAKKNKIDMIAMLPRKHNIFQRLFTESNTKKMAFHSEVPVLALV